MSRVVGIRLFVALPKSLKQGSGWLEGVLMCSRGKCLQHSCLSCHVYDNCHDHDVCCVHVLAVST